MPNNQLLEKFIDLKIQAKKIDEEIEMCKAQVQAEVEKILAETGEGTEQVTLQSREGISFSLAKARPKWEYSKNLTEAQQIIKDKMKVEEQTGQAKNLNEGKKELRVNLPK